MSAVSQRVTVCQHCPAAERRAVPEGKSEQRANLLWKQVQSTKDELSWLEIFMVVQCLRNARCFSSLKWVSGTGHHLFRVIPKLAALGNMQDQKQQGLLFLFFRTHRKCHQIVPTSITLWPNAISTECHRSKTAESIHSESRPSHLRDWCVLSLQDGSLAQPESHQTERSCGPQETTVMGGRNSRTFCTSAPSTAYQLLSVRLFLAILWPCATLAMEVFELNSSQGTLLLCYLVPGSWETKLFEAALVQALWEQVDMSTYKHKKVISIVKPRFFAKFLNRLNRYIS